jgi:hypothetical protein
MVSTGFPPPQAAIRLGKRLYAADSDFPARNATAALGYGAVCGCLYRCADRRDRRNRERSNGSQTTRPVAKAKRTPGIRNQRFPKKAKIRKKPASSAPNRLRAHASHRSGPGQPGLVISASSRDLQRFLPKNRPEIDQSLSRARVDLPENLR